MVAFACPDNDLSFYFIFLSRFCKKAERFCKKTVICIIHKIPGILWAVAQNINNFFNHLPYFILNHNELLLKGRTLQTLVENQSTFAAKNSELHVFETHQQAENVLLKFDQPVLASMLEGKKIMKLRDKNPFDFVPGESIMMPSGELMDIDFPEARMDRPTKCLALTISSSRIEQVLALMNEQMSRADDQHWRFEDFNFHFSNDVAIYKIIQKLMFLFAEDHDSKEFFIELTLQELIVRIMQNRVKQTHESEVIEQRLTNRMAYVLDYIRKNLHRTLTIEELSEQACMSLSGFHKSFKTEMGMSAVDYINQQRIRKAARMLADPNQRVKDVYCECGFSSPSYFNRVFKRWKSLTPKAYQKRRGRKDQSDLASA